jgi:hypothetical protein
MVNAAHLTFAEAPPAFRENFAWESPEVSGATTRPRRKRTMKMANKTLFAALVLGFSLIGANAYADNALVNGALGAGAGAVVGGPVGAVAGGAIGYTQGHKISHAFRGNGHRYHHHHHHYHHQY